MTMIKLVSLDAAQAHLRLSETDDEADVHLKIAAASRIVLKALGSAADFLNSDGTIDYDSGGDPQDIPEDIQAATLLLLACFYDDRDGSVLLTGGLPEAVISILNSYGRKPILA
jgi:Phage gp6-like head-tail connector protein